MLPKNILCNLAQCITKIAKSRHDYILLNVKIQTFNFAKIDFLPVLIIKYRQGMLNCNFKFLESELDFVGMLIEYCC